MIQPPDVRKMRDVMFWHNIAPDLSIAEHHEDFATPSSCAELDIQNISYCLNTDGYFRSPPVFRDDVLARFRACMIALDDAHIPPVFIYVYDEPWVLFQQLSTVLEHLLGNRFILLPNLWAWNIPLHKGESGWPPHRDCQARTRFPVSSDPTDTILMSLSLWIPLSDATIHNGCMTVLSREYSDQIPFGEGLPARFAEMGVPLPAAAGSVLGWTQDLYHWSNTVTTTGTELGNIPRMSLSLEFQNSGFDPLAEPALDIHTPPVFSDRLRLIAQQFVKYSHLEDVSFDASQLLD